MKNLARIELCYKKQQGASQMSRGGKREGAGRPKKEPTIVTRIPESKRDVIHALLNDEYKVPLYQSKVQAGLPSPAEDSIEARIDLNQYLITNPSSTFLVRATGYSMINAGILPNNILVVDTSLPIKHGTIVIAAIDGELTLKRWYQKDGTTKLQAENPDYPDIELTSEQCLNILGVVTNSINPL